MAVFSFDWARVEGNKIPNLRDKYGDFIHLPSSSIIFYTTPEIQIYNPTSLINGIAYKVVPISEFGYASIKEIDANYVTLLNTINTYDKTIDISDDVNSANYYYEPFVVEESSIIFYEDSTKKTFGHYCIVYVDPAAEPDIITVVGEYTGPPMPYGSIANKDDINLFVVYSDGEKAILKSGYTITPSVLTISKVGSNVFTITYNTPKNGTFTCSIIISGIKAIVGIDVTYDGSPVAYGVEALRKHFVVVAKFSDGSETTVSDFSFPSGNVVSKTNKGILPVYYKGFTKTVTVPTYEVTSSRLMAYYTGPPVEVGHDVIKSYFEIKIYYASKDNEHTHYESVSYESCTISPVTIDHEGVNYITISFTGKAGNVTTKAAVIGITPEVTLNFITAEYTGQEIVKGKTFSPERVLVKAHYSDGSITTIKNFSLNTNIVSNVGINEYVATYKYKDTSKTATFTVIGLEPDSTMENGYSPIYLNNHYPDATRLNNRYRGSVEAYKHDNTAKMFYNNITDLYNVFKDIEQTFNQYTKDAQGDDCVKNKIFYTVKRVDDTVLSWINDSRFNTGKYIAGEVHNE